MTYSIWLIPSKQDAKHLNTIIKNLAKKYNAPKFSAHITVYSGITSLDDAKSAVQLLNSPKIRVRKLGIARSEYLWKTLYLRIKKDKKLGAIHKILARKLRTKYVFLPHISLIYKKLDDTTKRKIIKTIKTKNSFVFDAVAIIRSSKNVHQWKVLYRTGLDASRVVKFSKSLRS
jgi:2'-5' RNA ligase